MTMRPHEVTFDLCEVDKGKLRHIESWDTERRPEMHGDNAYSRLERCLSDALALEYQASHINPAAKFVITVRRNVANVD